MSKGFRITVEDLDTGDKQAMVVHLASSQAYPKSGTMQITLKGYAPQAEAAAVTA